jgi:Zn-dependent M32 family carboxypeptidase
MNNKKEIIEKARELAWYKTKQTRELSSLIKTYDNKVESWNKDVKHLVNQMKDRILKLTK